MFFAALVLAAALIAPNWQQLLGTLAVIVLVFWWLRYRVALDVAQRLQIEALDPAYLLIVQAMAAMFIAGAAKTIFRMVRGYWWPY